MNSIVCVCTVHIREKKTFLYNMKENAGFWVTGHRQLKPEIGLSAWLSDSWNSNQFRLFFFLQLWTYHYWFYHRHILKSESVRKSEEKNVIRIQRNAFSSARWAQLTKQSSLQTEKKTWLAPKFMFTFVFYSHCIC